MRCGLVGTRRQDENDGKTVSNRGRVFGHPVDGGSHMGVNTWKREVPASGIYNLCAEQAILEHTVGNPKEALST